MSNGKTPNGYAIKKSVLFENGKGFVLGENPAEPEPFATWQFTDTNGIIIGGITKRPCLPPKRTLRSV